MGCMVRCRRYSAITEGPFAPTYTKGPEYDVINALGAKPYITDPAVILRAQYLCDDLRNRCADVQALPSPWPWSFTSGGS